jgi:hypothetical protein
MQYDYAIHWMIKGPIPGKGNDGNFSLPPCPEQLQGSLSLLLLRLKMHGAIPPLLKCVFMAWCSVKHRNNFTFIFY